MPQSWKPFALAVVLSLTALGIVRFTWPLLSGAPFAFLFAAVAAVSHWGSGRAGFVAIVIGAIGAAFTFPTTGPAPFHPATLLIFVPASLIGSWIVAGRKKAETTLRANEERLRRAQKMEAVGQLVAGVAHNFNNLLTITMGYTDELLDRHKNDADGIAVREIRKATERGAALTRQLLAFGRKHDAGVARVDLGRALADLRDMLTRVSREDIRLTIDAKPGSAAVMIDPHDLEQVVVNLVINARDALPSGGTIAIDIGREKVDGADYVRLRVRDDGIGMSPEVQSHLFEPFFTTKEVGEGTGLGLAFVHGIARHGRGFVTVDSAPGKGTTVSFCLPSADPAPARSPIEQAATREPATPPHATILLVEDDTAVRSMTQQMLTRAGYRVLPAALPSQAMTAFDRHAHEIDLLITDVIMPEMHGPVLAERLIAKRPTLPVLFVSGYSDEMPASAQSSATVGFLAKPFASSRLVAAITELLAAKTV